MPIVVEKLQLPGKSGTIDIPAARLFLDFTIEDGRYFTRWLRNTSDTATVTRQFAISEERDVLPDLGVTRHQFFYNQDEARMIILTIFSS